jgi:outer membrane protein assembly factor BamB
MFASKPIASGAWTPGALAMWQEAINITPANAPPPDPAAGAGAAPAQLVTGGTRWLLVPVAGKLAADVTASNGAVTSGAIVALKVTNDGGKLSLAPGWTSRDVASPITPLVVNGVVFAASAGPTATLYAFNGSTGKELWTSGRTITGPLSGRSFWAGSGQVYAGTVDGTVYAFGFAMERK